MPIDGNVHYAIPARDVERPYRHGQGDLGRQDQQGDFLG
jgi:hypothetical protein